MDQQEAPESAGVSPLSSVVQVIGEHESECNYCGENLHRTFGMWAYRLSAHEYQMLIDKGWRRSGQYIYRPHNRNACCQQFVIRMRLDSFRISKAQKKTLKRWRALLSEHSESAAATSSSSSTPSALKNALGRDRGHGLKKQAPDVELQELLQIGRDRLRHAACLTFPELEKDIFKLSDHVVLRVVSPAKHRETSENRTPRRLTRGDERQHATSVVSTLGFALSQVRRKREAAIRIVMDQKQVQASQVHMAESIVEKINMLRSSSNDAAFRRFELWTAVSPGFINSTVQCHVIVTGAVHHDNLSAPQAMLATQPNLRGSGQKEKIRGSELRFEMAPSSFVQDEFELYRKYNAIVHGKTEDQSQRSYEQFLCDSPLPDGTVPSEGEQASLGELAFRALNDPESNDFAPCSTLCLEEGSYHVRYILDDVLVAVGVVDILPGCVSSVYVFYDPDIGNLSPGVFSALWEIQLGLHLSRNSSHRKLQYYYMGFYIDNNRKMVYKNQYGPCELLCEETQSWVPYPLARRVLDLRSGTVRLAPEGTLMRSECADPAGFEGSLENMALLLLLPNDVSSRQVVRFQTFSTFFATSHREQVASTRRLLKSLIKLTGPQAAAGLMVVVELY
ncbi:Arginyl-tRNA--protein transferase 2 [Porphyridium purpureum]|uniref:Arginyl-tRNA--protein transferase 1 n=1 Tax=Porphyridium purpureum TaxID=35688 RepID=A0A5J4Z5Z6_PORPP|nr:Arginyl-tRNA--protein transferase 2 [Porphyridium purpureum]|eukprot:POR2932..scf295_1